MLKKIFVLLSLVMVIGLAGCSGLGGGETTAESTSPAGTNPPGNTSEPSDTTAPSQSTDPVDPVQPPAATANDPLTDAVPAYDTTSADTIVLESENGALDATYIHLFGEAASAVHPFDGEVFWVCRDEQEMLQGNHYDLYALEDGQLRKLESKDLSRDYTLFGDTVHLELSYAIYEDQVYITYYPHADGADAMILDTSRGADECLFSFQLQTPEGPVAYFAVVDLQTGKMTDILSGFDPALFREKYYYSVSEWTADGRLLLCTTEKDWLYLDPASGTAIESESLLPDEGIKNCYLTSDGIVCQSSHADSISDRGTLWKISFSGESETKLLDNVIFKELTPGCPYAVYRNDAGAYYLYDPQTGESAQLAGFPSKIEYCSDRCLVYRDSKEACRVFDVQDMEETTLELPEGWEGISGWEGSPGGGLLMVSQLDETGTRQLLIFNLRTNALTEFHRTNPNGVREGCCRWIDEDTILIHSNDHREFYVYDLEE